MARASVLAFFNLLGTRWHPRQVLEDVEEARWNRSRLRDARKRRPPASPNPLVSVRIATYNRAQQLVERSIPSALNQTHENVEVVVVGDHCTDDTAERVRAIRDPRVRFENLAERGRYPTHSYKRWQVAGSVPMNRALDICKGEWIAPLDDDDEFTPDHVSTLLSTALDEDCEMVFGILDMEQKPDSWKRVGQWPPRLGQICHSAVMFRRDIGFIRHRLDSFRWDEPGDWNVWRRMRRAGVRMGFVPRVVGRHYIEGTRWGV